MLIILSATQDEISFFTSRLNVIKSTEINNIRIYNAEYLKYEILIVISGVGIKKARKAINLILTKYRPKHILSVGFSGALTESTSVGDIILGTEVISLTKLNSYNLYSDFPYISIKHSRGKLLTENRFINTIEEKKDLAEKSGALCVDMETYGIADMLGDNDVRLTSIRVVSDGLSSNLPRMEKLFNKESKFDIGKAFKYFLINPCELVSFLRFKFICIRKAKIRLAGFVSYLIPLIFEQVD